MGSRLVTGTQLGPGRCLPPVGRVPGPLEKEVFYLADEEQPRCFDVATTAAHAAGFTGEVVVSPASLVAFTEVFDKNEFTTSLAQSAPRIGLGTPGRSEK